MTGIGLDWPTTADDELYAGLHRVIAAVATLGGAVGFLAVPERAQIDAWVDQRLALVGTGRLRLAVARIDGEIVGTGYWESETHAVRRHIATISKVMTHPDARGRGVARTVTQALADDARASGFEQVVLNVRGNNHAALTLYESLGFEPYGRLTDGVAVGSERFDLVYLRRVLRHAEDVIRHGGRSTGPGASTARA